MYIDKTILLLQSQCLIKGAVGDIVFLKSCITALGLGSFTPRASSQEQRDLSIFKASFLSNVFVRKNIKELTVEFKITNVIDQVR